MAGIRPVIFIRPICLPKTQYYYPLWMRHVEYPKVFPGDPPVQCFLPPFWMKMMYPGPKNPPDHVVFKVHPQMTKRDVWQYLEKIYNVPVVDVRVKMVYHDLEPVDISVEERTQRLNDSTNFPPKPERYEKVAYVRLAPGEVFVFPDLFKDKRPSDPLDVLDDDFVNEPKNRQGKATSHSSRKLETNKLQPLKGGIKWFGF
ncbi:39S ribosomal protein L23 isoform 2 [Schistosoma japonicum]|uniref:Large ribosomal subunit protein uL23m n=2 Tax=Schistosoma japonicum TaxID=6182 RepID=C1LM17_SCHJA|nr:39S ribosomal protein L23 isoform 2 [Schistosoma japonicum]CAX75742.1 mitochondrial ribosomal protein L23 [Schistosoma japonicum]CAX75744.1 mitochondrial ribosomal protein L23 [Schistosoma japonicum]CAX75745.1 mitochondrial ribosomal protein L23 [Schistosoma japonicum]